MNGTHAEGNPPIEWWGYDTNRLARYEVSLRFGDRGVRGDGTIQALAGFKRISPDTMVW
ncbi:MAG TPA: hypothetical protein VHX11_12110 [Acidobacteriaceae bacterium]|nr:hypothetical protein [Acidobacteriaceae bacterium]